MTLQEFFKDFYKSNPIDQTKANKELYELVMGFGNDSVKLIAKAMDERCRNNYVHPDVLINDILIPIGLTSSEKLERFILSVDTTDFNTKAYLNIIDPKVPYFTDMRVEPWNTFIYYIRVATGIRPLDIEASSDSRYRLFTPGQLEQLVNLSPVQYWRYVPEIRDCDDYNNGVIGWLSKWGAGDYGIVSVRATVLKSGKEYMHRFCGALTSDNDFYLWEPQTRHFWKHGSSSPIWEIVEFDWIRKL